MVRPKAEPIDLFEQARGMIAELEHLGCVGIELDLTRECVPNGSGVPIEFGGVLKVRYRMPDLKSATEAKP